jgi:hypothetical protein
MPAISGFDCGGYPGDDAVTKWARKGSPFQFFGFYLPAPCHSPKSFAPFKQKYKLLKSLGWGLAIVYVGRQVTGCGSKSLTSDVGKADGLDAIARSHAEGFPPSSIVYLDVEPFDGSLPANMKDYVQGWTDALLQDDTYEPGIYCHAKNAIDLHTLGEDRFAAAGRPAGAPSFWITRPKASFNPDTSVPADSGISFATLWQGQIDTKAVTHSGATISSIDVNVALTANPSNA